MSSRLPKKIIKKIRREVLSGKSKYQVAKEMHLLNQTVYYITKDIPSKKPGRTEIRGKSLELLKQLIQDGYVVAKTHTSSQFRTLRKHFPTIQRAEIEHKVIYYFEDKNKIALQALLQRKRSRIVDYPDLAKMAQVFGIPLSSQEKKAFLGKIKKRCTRKNHISNQESTGGNDDFLGRFLHSEVLWEL